MGDAENGKKLFMKMCSSCHTSEKDGKHRIGPNLFGVVGRTCGTMPGYNFTDYMKKRNITWDDNFLDQYLQVPKKVVPGTKMAFAGMKKADERKDMIAYLHTLK